MRSAVTAWRTVVVITIAWAVVAAVHLYLALRDSGERWLPAITNLALVVVGVGAVLYRRWQMMEALRRRERRLGGRSQV